MMIPTPGSVFCSCKAVWARIALSRSQYVKKAQPMVKNDIKIKNFNHTVCIKIVVYSRDSS